MSFNVSYARGTAIYPVGVDGEVSAEYDGYGFNGTFEKFLTNYQWSIGFGVSWLTAALPTVTLSDGTIIRADVSLTPVFVTGRYNFGNEWIRPYIGAGAGIVSAHYNKTTTSTTAIESTSRQADASLMFVVPLGAFVRITDKVYANLNYTPMFGTNNDIADGVTHAVTVGIAFPN